MRACTKLVFFYLFLSSFLSLTHTISRLFALILADHVAYNFSRFFFIAKNNSTGDAHTKSSTCCCCCCYVYCMFSAQKIVHIFRCCFIIFFLLLLVLGFCVLLFIFIFYHFCKLLHGLYACVCVCLSLSGCVWCNFQLLM